MHVPLSMLPITGPMRIIKTIMHVPFAPERDPATQTVPDLAGLLSTYIAALHPIDPAMARMALMRHEPNVGDLLADDGGTSLLIIDLLAPRESDLAFAAQKGLSLNLVRIIGSDTIGFAAEGGMTFPIDDDEVCFDAAVLTVTAAFRRRDYMHPFFQAGGFVSLDPFNGQRLVSTHSLVIDTFHIAYRFAGCETFYVVVGGIGGTIRFCSIPRLNCIIAIPNFGENEQHVAWSGNVHRRLVEQIIRHGTEATLAFSVPRPMTAVAIGFHGNLGHTIWQDLAGLEEILHVHGPAAVQHLLVGPHPFFPLLDIFPELADRPVHHVTAEEDPLVVSLALPFQHMRPIGVMIQPNLRRRIQHAAKTHCPPAVKRQIAVACTGRFVVWVTLRANLKVWTRQVSGHIDALRQLATDVGPMLVVIDGWDNTAVDAAALRAGLEQHGITVIEILGCGLYEAILWAEAAHLYSAVVGSSLFVNSYFANRPGVAHANTVHMHQANYWAAMSPGSCAPTFIEIENVKDEGRLFDNYDFPPELLYQKMSTLVKNIYPERLVHQK